MNSVSYSLYNLDEIGSCIRFSFRFHYLVDEKNVRADQAKNRSTPVDLLSCYIKTPLELFVISRSVASVKTPLEQFMEIRYTQ